MEIKKWIKKHAKEICLSLIVSLITFVITEGVKLIVKIAPTAGNSVWRFFSNSFFVAAAKMTDTSVTTFILSSLIGIAVAYIIFLMHNALVATKKTITRAEGILDDIKTPKVKATGRKEEITTEEIENDAKDIIKEAKRGRGITIVAIVFFIFYFGRIILFNLWPHSLWTDYQRDLLKIAPYIEQQEQEQLESDWACMQSKEDYEGIYKRINDIKNEHYMP